MIGKQIGPYAVLSKLGEGGMGEVWRATDTNLGRQVAIKVLPDAFAQDRERLARFEREAKTLAALSHPNIAIIHGLEKSDGAYALVMELVEGSTLADRIARGAIPVDEAVPIAKQIAEALEAAHEQAIVHRDVKPANIRVREDGTVKVLDFGLAKALDPAQGSGRFATAHGSGLKEDLSNSPTITSPAMTALGMILGTAAYMAPEQARGKPVDKRADIWAFGCVLFEMLTGRKPFEGDDVSLTLSKILQRDPDWTALPAGTPSSIRRLLDRCLDKDPKRRLRDIGEARLILERPVDAGVSEPAPAARLRAWQRPLVAAIAALTLVAATAATVWLAATRTPSSIDGSVREAGTRRLNIVLPDEAPLVFIGEGPGGVGLTALALSPDGQRLVYVGRAGDTTRLYLRDMNNAAVRALAGTEGAYAPFFSPDSRWIAFFSGRQLMRASLDDGQSSPITEASWGFGGSWSDDGRIAIVTNDGTRLSIVDSRSGRVSLVKDLGTNPRRASPSWLPGSDWLLFTCYEPQHICAFSVRTGEARHLVLNDRAASTYEGVALLTGSNPHYVSPGFLVYSAARDNVVMAARFDPATLTVAGDPVALLRGVRREILAGAIQLSTSDDGDTVFAMGINAVVGKLVWAGRGNATGEATHKAFTPRTYGPFHLSPDGRRIVIKSYPDTGPPEIWFLDIVTGDERRWVDEGLLAGREPWPGPWTPGGRRVVVHAWGRTFDVFEIDGDRASGGDRIWSGRGELGIEAIGDDGRSVAFVGSGTRPWYLTLIGLKDVRGLPADASAVLKPLVPSTGQQNLSDLSPDMKWLAYTSDESGQYEVWAARLPLQGAPKQVTNRGCETPRWSPKGDGMFYRCGQRWYWAALSGSDDPPFRPPELFLEGDYLNIAGPEYEVSPDGTRLLLLQGSGERTTGTLDVITNWRAELERRLPEARE